METFGAPVLEDVQFNQDGSLKNSGKQNVKFYPKKRLSFRAKRDENNQLIMDKKTGLPEKEAFEEVVEMIRVETKGDTNIIDDVANDFHKRQFYRHYKYFRDGKIPDGNPIEDFEFLQPSTVMELHMLGIHVIQQVAEMSELECSQLKDQSGFEVKDYANQWIRINSPQGQASKASRLEIENAALKRKLEDALSARNRPIKTTESFIEPQEETPSIETMEVSAEDLKSRKRKV